MSMQQTPASNRQHIAVFGTTNAGKSALVNALTGSDISIVSHVSGTTTDPVKKAMELLGFGPVVFVDTAGLNDQSLLGLERMKRSHKVLDRCNFVLYALDGSTAGDAREAELAGFEAFQKLLQERHVPHMALVTKADLLTDEQRRAWISRIPDVTFVSVEDAAGIEALRQKLIDMLRKTATREPGLLDGVLNYGDTAILVIPIDSEAPQGRLILPQVQMIRAALDLGVRCVMTSELQLAEVISELPKVDLIITDSQAFHVVAKLVPAHIPLTSFSILMARQKGQFEALVSATKKIADLRDGDRILISEACSHNKSHEDIGSVKIPLALRRKTGKMLEFDYVVGHDFPENLSVYALVVHCGSCMITAKEFQNRFRYAEKQAVPMTNYGTVLAYTSGILERSVAALGIEL